MATAGIALVAVLAVSVLLGLALYGAVRSEHDRRTVTDRESGERAARRDTTDRAPGDDDR
ncbi:hypothetical protein GJ629_12860 [Halapricum sp. CBA1109]|nr:hypothetical protein [Halapricum sp. CBA1109]MUV90676.1 hypothetical protein [Halapricum sp. CBA1109]